MCYYSVITDVSMIELVQRIHVLLQCGYCVSMIELVLRSEQNRVGAIHQSSAKGL
jgi:bacterioferritin-associated ferredoxin